MYVVRHMSHTSQRAGTLERGMGQPKGGWPSRHKGPWRERWTFYCFIWIICGGDEKGETGWCAQRVVATYKVVVARSDMSICHLGGCWLLYVTHTSSVIICCSLTKSVWFYQTKPTAELLCSRTMPTLNVLLFHTELVPSSCIMRVPVSRCLYY